MTPASTYTRLLGMPKAEVHVHLEGSIQPETLLALARHHHRVDSLPATTVDGLRQWFQFTDFPHFIEVYTTISDLLRTPADFALITADLAAELSRQHVRYAEVTFTPFTHTHLLDKKLSIDDLLAGLDEGRARAQTQHQVTLQWVFDIPRNVSFRGRGALHYDPFCADTTLAYAIQGLNHGVIAFGLGGNEAGAPAAPFAHAFRAAAEAGLLSLPHAGEMAGPESVWAALHALRAHRIGHGVRAIEDPLLLAYLAAHQIPLEVSITSNIRLHVYRSLGAHPFPHLDRMGVLVTVNSDDPPLFNTDLTQEYALLVDEFGYTWTDVARIARNAMRVCAAPPPLRAQMLAELEAWVAANLTDPAPAAAPP
jgi:adenosine deaminase